MKMDYKLVHVGFGNMVVADRIVAIINPSSSPIKRLKEEAREAGLLVDVTQGRKTRAILVMDSRHVVLSAIQPETITSRFEGEDDKEEKE
jgi:extracellular matrix regulatory protein A